ncbi:MAG TPA: ATP synthase F1 subunit gamma [Syntrophorhabdales bacterium]|nr:ATP synthase F1 subunit gamma [Syntrophorhabdales bacterium]
MATLREVKRKIGSVRSTQTITRTMRMISASKLRRAQDELERVNGYALRMEGLLKRMASRIPDNASPLLSEREEIKRVLLFPIASDRGLSGAFNINVAGEVEGFIHENKAKYDNIEVYLVGKKIRDYLRRRGIKATKEWVDMKTVGQEIAGEMATDLTGLYLAGEVDRVYLIYTRFQSALKQEVKFEEFLPLKAPASEETVDYLYEPDVQSIVDRFIPHYILTKIYYALVESQTSEHAARMAAMENATNNCGEMIDYLTLVYNKTRQQSITNEMMDIVGGVEALQST